MQQAIDKVGDIIDGRGHYGTTPIVTREVAPGVIWYGSPGVSASVGMWIRRTNELLKDGQAITGFWRWWAAEHDAGTKRMWYFGAEIGGILHVVGGCTDFSGEGGRAKDLAAAYQEFFPTDVYMRPVSQLIDLLVDGWHSG